MSKLLMWSLIGLGWLALSAGLAWVSLPESMLNAWLPFLLLTGIGGGLIWIGWALIRAARPPVWLLWLTVGAALLRLAMGVVWFVALPVAGYGNPTELAGYVMADAFERDQTAYDLGRSGQTLSAFSAELRGVDQYGGLLFVSALVYGVLGGDIHQPLQMVVLAAACSALAVPFTWALTRRLWPGAEDQTRSPAVWAAWGMALYPEAVLLGSSQMREAFAIPLIALAVLGVTEIWQAEKRRGWGMLLAGLALLLLLSAPVAALCVAVLIVLQAAHGNWLRYRWLWATLIAVIVLSAILAGLAWSNIVPGEAGNLLQRLWSWLERSAFFEQYYAEQASGWIQRIFDDTPEFLHSPFLTLYGLSRPFLPAVLVAGGAPIWQAIGIWRALGWTLLAGLLIVAGLLWLRHPRRHALSGAILGLVLVFALLASFRSAGDMWDNPRYRALLASLQIGLAAWAWSLAWVRYRRLLLYGATSLGWILIWFIPWYLRRYTPLEWPVSDPFKTIMLGVTSALLFILWDWARRQPLPNPGDKT